MSYRFMRLMVFFDLLTATSENRRNYRRFRKDLISNGFFMLQESVYCRMVINEAMAKSVVARIESFKPPQGMVCAMIITEKQFAGISFIVGDMKSDVVTTEQSLVIL